MLTATRSTGWVRRASVSLLSLTLLAAAACTSSPGATGTSAPSASGTSAPVPAPTPGSTNPAGTASSAAGSAAASSPAAESSSPAAASSPAESSSPAAAPSTVAPSSTFSSAAPSTTPPALPAAAVVASPALGAADLSPATPITIAVKNGTIKALSLTSASGKPVAGKLSADASSWKLGEDLGYGKTYTVTGTAVGRNGRPEKIAGTYTTVEPDGQAHVTVSPGDGVVVGVAAPIIVRFSSEVTDKAAMEQRLKVVTTPAVDGSWAWITHDGDTYPSLDWRPKQYWPQFTKVHVAANVYGQEFSAGVYGAADVTSDFSIGRNQVVIADAKKYDIVVQQSGRTVATYPGSYGMGDDPNSRYGLKSQFVTRSGTHIVMGKQETVSMSNPGYYTNSIEHWAVRISDNGEFIHENPNTVDEQGNTNVSHGCINLSAASAEAYFKSAIYGDPVEISGTSVKLSAADGDIYDWALTWPQWQALSAG
jgi:lipoprotein-anchoring transpeptidase ErfK/SrfK